MTKSVMLKITKWFSIVMGIFLLLLIIAGIVLMVIVDKEFVEGKMSAALNRQVVVGKINAGIFSAVSGLGFTDLRISDFKTLDDLKAMMGKPVVQEDLFLEIKSFRLKVKLASLLRKKLEIKELSLQDSYLRIVTLPDGSYNFSDLLETETVAEEKPMTADDLGGAVLLENLSANNCTIDMVDRASKQNLRFYDFFFNIPVLNIDPADLQNKNSLEMNVKTGVKSLGEFSGSGFKSFDIRMQCLTKMKIFSPQTRILEPQIIVTIKSPQGVINGVKAITDLRENGKIKKFCGKLDFLKEDLNWHDGRVDMEMANGNVTLKNGSIETEDMRLTFSGSLDMNTEMTDLDLGLLLAAKYTPIMKNNVQKEADRLIKGETRKYVTGEKIAVMAMKRVVNANGRIFLEIRVSGKLSQPKTTLIKPELPSLTELIKQSMGSYLQENRGEIEKKGKKLLNKIF